MKKLTILSFLLIISGMAFSQSSKAVAVKAKPVIDAQKIKVQNTPADLKSKTLNQPSASQKIKNNSVPMQKRAPKLYFSLEEMQEDQRREKEQSKNPN